MTEIRGEAEHGCARILLKYEKAKKGKTTLKLSKVIKRVWGGWEGRGFRMGSM